MASFSEDEMQHESKSSTLNGGVGEYVPLLLPNRLATRILCVGQHAALLDSRRLVLSQAGYYVRSCTSERAAQLCLSDSFDIVLVCRSVPDAVSVLLTETLRMQLPNLQIIRLKPTSSPELKLYDLAVDTANGPVHFLHDLGKFVRQQQRSH